MKSLGKLLAWVGGFSLVMTGLQLWKVGFPRLEGPEGASWLNVLRILAPYAIVAAISLGLLGLGNYLASRPEKPDGAAVAAKIQKNTELEKEKVLHSPLVQEARIVNFYRTTLQAWQNGKVDALNPRFKTDVEGLQTEDLIKKHPPYQGSMLGLFFESYPPLDGEFMLVLGHASTDKSPWCLLTNRRLIQKDGVNNEFHEFPLEQIDSFRALKKSWTAQTLDLKLKLKSGQEVNLDKVLCHPSEKYLTWAIGQCQIE